MSGRKRKTPADWARDHPDDLETKKKKMPNDCNADVLTCKYCAVEIDVISSGKKPWDRVNKHLGSKRHKRMKENYKERQQEGRQLTLFESEVRAKAKEQEAEGAVHDFV